MTMSVCRDRRLDHIPTSWPNLNKSIQLGRLTVKNRIEAAPSLPNLGGATGFVTRELVEYYRAKAKGGAGIVTVGESAIDSEYAPSHGAQIVVDHDNKIPGLNALAEAIKRYGARASLQLCHAGRQTTPDLIGKKKPIAPSPIPSAFHEMLAGGSIVVQEMSLEMIDQVVENYADAALRLKRSGFDMTSIHGGHGWLPAQFLSPLTNLRTDEYGGAIENRTRFCIRVLERIRERCGPEFALAYRFSAEELVPGGLELEEAVQFARLIEDRVDCLEVSCGMIADPSTIPHTHPAHYLPHGRNVALARTIRAAITTPVTVVGAILDLDLAEKTIAEGSADMVAMCRALIADPQLPKKTLSGHKKDVIPCIRCNECLARVAIWWPMKCTVNPLAGREVQYPDFGTASTKKRVLVAGGGPAGMQAAIVAAERGHEVTLLESSDALGGNLFAASRPSFKDDMKRFLDYLVHRVSTLPIEVRLATPASATLVKTEAPDVLFVAVGAEPFTPDVPGIDGENVVWAGDVLAGRVQTGERVLVVGGDRAGCESALLLSMQGKQVVLVEESSELATDVNIVNRPLLLDLLPKHGVEIRSKTSLQAIFASGALIHNSNGHEERLTVETVALSLGMRPRTVIVEELSSLAPETTVIGDALSPRLLYNAIHEAFEGAVEV